MDEIKDIERLREMMIIINNSLYGYMDNINDKRILKAHNVEVGDFIEHIEEPYKGAVGVVLGTLNGFLYVRYINYNHIGYPIHSRFIKSKLDDIKKRIDISKEIKY